MSSLDSLNKTKCLDTSDLRGGEVPPHLLPESVGPGEVRAAQGPRQRQRHARCQGLDTSLSRTWSYKGFTEFNTGVHLVVGDRLPLGLEVVVPAGLVYTQSGVERFEGNFLN